MNALERFERRDWLAALIVFVACLGLRVPFRSQYAYHWDSAQFALAIEHYDLRLGLPHRPGYFLYVMLGRLVNLVVGEPHTSLVWMSVVAGASLAALGYLLGAALFGRGCGMATATILGTGPLCWFHSEVALTTIVDGALVTATVLICWRAMRRGGGWPWVVGMAIMLGVVAGVRQQTGPLLLPAWLYATSKFSRQRWAKLAVGVVLTGLICLAWFVPMAQSSGGLGAYARLLRARMEMDAPLTPWSGGVRPLIENVSFIAASCWVGLFAAVLLAGTEIIQSALRRKPAGDRGFLAHHRQQFLLLAIWILPMMAFGIATFTLMPGYVLSYFPAVASLIGLSLNRLAYTIGESLPADRFANGGRCAVGMGIVLMMVGLANVTIFLLPPGWTKDLRAGLPVTAADILDHDAQLGRWFQAIRATWKPNEVLICHYGQSFYWGFRHFQYHLPEYDNCLLTSDRALAAPWDKKLWYARNRRVSFVDCFGTLNKRILVLVVSPGDNVERFAGVLDASEAVKWEISSSAPLYTLRSEPNHTD